MARLTDTNMLKPWTSMTPPAAETTNAVTAAMAANIIGIITKCRAR